MTLFRPLLTLALRRPHRIPAMLGLAWAFRARGWFLRFPFLPLPPASYTAWRMDTAYGDPRAVPPQDELERFVVWAARMRRRM